MTLPKNENVQCNTIQQALWYTTNDIIGYDGIEQYNHTVKYSTVQYSTIQYDGI